MLAFKHVNEIKVADDFSKLSLNVLSQTLFGKKIKNKNKNQTIRMIGHIARLRDAMDQSYPIYACTCANHVHYSSCQVNFAVAGK